MISFFLFFCTIPLLRNIDDTSCYLRICHVLIAVTCTVASASFHPHSSTQRARQNRGLLTSAPWLFASFHAGLHQRPGLGLGLPRTAQEQEHRNLPHQMWVVIVWEWERGGELGDICHLSKMEFVLLVDSQHRDRDSVLLFVRRWGGHQTDSRPPDEIGRLRQSQSHRSRGFWWSAISEYCFPHLKRSLWRDWDPCCGSLHGKVTELFYSESPRVDVKSTWLQKAVRGLLYCGLHFYKTLQSTVWALFSTSD